MPADSTRPEIVTPVLLRQWPLPAAKDSKYARGQVLVVGGAARTPGAALLTGLAVLRVGAGHLTLAVAEAAAVPMAVATPEAGVYGLPQNAQGSVRGHDLSAITDTLGQVDVAVVGPGLDDAEETATLLRNLVPLLGPDARVVLDAYALGVLPGAPEIVEALRGRLVLTPNKNEGQRLLERELTDLESDVAEMAERYGAVVTPEAGVYGLPQNAQGSVRGHDLSAITDTLGQVDVAVVGPGLDDAEETATLLRNLVPLLGPDTRVVLDAYALGVLPGAPEIIEALRGRSVLTPNKNEGQRLLDRELSDLESDVAEIAERYGAVVTSQNVIADPDGHRWRIGSGQEGLATSGSGDVLAGAVAGLLARGATAAQAACWGTHLHAAAGDRLASRVGAVGFLARELLDQLPLIVVELST